MPSAEELAQQEEQIRQAAFRRERRSQLRGLLLIALAALAFMLARAQPLHLFQSNWWRP